MIETIARVTGYETANPNKTCLVVVLPEAEPTLETLFAALNEDANRASMNAAYHATRRGEDVAVLVENASNVATVVVDGIFAGAGCVVDDVSDRHPTAAYFAAFKAYQITGAAGTGYVPVTKNHVPGEPEPFVDDELLTLGPGLTVDKVTTVIEWVRDGLRPIQSPNKKHTSYGLKHMLEHETGVYLTNNQFKHAMAVCGFDPVDVDALNAQYRISERSPALARERARMRA